MPRKFRKTNPKGLTKKLRDGKKCTKEAAILELNGSDLHHKSLPTPLEKASATMISVGTQTEPSPVMESASTQTDKPPILISVATETNPSPVMVSTSTETDQPAISPSIHIQTDSVMTISNPIVSTEGNHPLRQAAVGHLEHASDNEESESEEDKDDVLDCLTPVRPVQQDVQFEEMFCEGNGDEMFLPLVKKHKGIFKDHSGKNTAAYFDQCYLTIRHVRCQWKLLVTSRSTRCIQCRAYRHVLRSGLDRLKKSQDTDSSMKCDPDSHVNYRYLDTPEKYERLQNMHKLIRKQSQQIGKLQQSLDKFIKTDGIAFDDNMNKDFLHIMNENTSTVLSAEEKFKSLFWQQQMKASLCRSKNGTRWHPAIIRWCLYLHHRSSGAYNTLRDSGVLALPSDRTLRDYRHFAPSSTGFSRDTDMQLLENLKQQKPTDLAKYVTIILDEMYIKEGLVFNKHSGEMIGFSDLGEVNELLAQYERLYKPTDAADELCSRPLAKCVLTFMIRGIFTKMQFVYAQFSAASTKGSDQFALLWKVIERLTLLDLEVIAVTCDGASNNRKLFELHGVVNGVPYKTANVYSEGNENIYFLRDPPHLIKTVRNCFSRGKLWCNGQCIDWKLIVQLYNQNAGAQTSTPGLCLVPKLKREHIYLNSFSKMRVDLATQVLSTTVSKALILPGDHAQETAKFVQKMDNFFDCFNVSSFSKGKLQRKPFLQPYRGESDFRLTFLQELVSYLDKWKESVDAREGFDGEAKKRMRLSWESEEGIRINVSSFLELVPRIFNIRGVTCFLSEKLSQDPLEKFFGCQRQAGRTNENPTVAEFLKNTQNLRVINSISLAKIGGNCRGTKRKSYDLESTEIDMPIQKRKRKRRHSK